jgi:hypothetical protein
MRFLGVNEMVAVVLWLDSDKVRRAIERSRTLCEESAEAVRTARQLRKQADRVGEQAQELADRAAFGLRTCRRKK